MLDKIKNFFYKGAVSTKKFVADGWMNPLSGLGTKEIDKVNQSFYRACPWFTFIELDEMYRSEGLTRRIIDIIPSDMIRQGWEVEGDADNLLNQKLDLLNAKKKLANLITWSRLYGGAIIVLGIADGRPLDQPVDLLNIRNVVWMHVFDRWQTMIDLPYLCQDLNSENYGYPEYYQIQDIRSGADFLVHHSRVLRMDWGQLPPREKYWNQGWGDSAIIPIYNELRNYGLSIANTSLMMQDFVNGVLKIPGLSNSLVTSGDCGNGSIQNQIFQRIDLANITKSTAQMMALDGDESYEKLSTNVSGVADIIDRFMLTVCSVTGIPATLLFGRSPAGLNSTGESDIRNYYDMIKQLQELKLKPLLEKLNTYIMLSKDGDFGGMELENWNIQFTPLWQNTEEQEATLRRTVAETDSIYIDRGVLDPNEVAISRFGGDRWSMNTIIDLKAREQGYDPNEIEDLEYQKKQEIKKMPPEAQVGPEIGNENNNIIIAR